MAMRTTFTVRGLRELDRALGELPKRTAKAVLRRTLIKAAEPIAEAARGHVPVDKGHLKRSITVTTRPPANADAGNRAYSQTLRGGGTRAEARQALQEARTTDPAAFAEVFVGPGRHPQAIMQEYGTVHHGPQPYLRPAFDAHATTALEIIRAELGAEIAKSARRIASRRSR